MAKRKKKLFKVDFEKIYNSISWNFLLYMLHRFDTWISWIKGCLKFSWVSVLINGSLTLKFKCYKGLCQGDSLVPFLFLVIVEGLSKLMRETKSKELFEGILVGNNNCIVNLLHHFYWSDSC